MPRRKLTVPSVFDDLEEHLLPRRPNVNRLVFPSPFKRWSGSVTLPLYLTAAEYNKWWMKAQEGQPEDDERHWALFEWETRFFMAKSWNLKDLDSDQINEDPLNLPDMRLAMWYVEITQPIIKEATNLPNSLAPSSNGSTV
jgi:hypothetical protein